MTGERKAVLRSVRLDDDVWAAIKALGCSLNQYLRNTLINSNAITAPDDDEMVTEPAARDLVVELDGDEGR